MANTKQKCLCCDADAVLWDMCMDCFWEYTELVEVNAINEDEEQKEKPDV